MILNDKYQNRRIFYYLFLGIIILIYGLRVFIIQTDKSVQRKAQSNAYARLTDYAPRGLIFDRNGKLLVSNQLTFDLMVTMHELNKLQRNPELGHFDTIAFCSLLNITRDDFDKRMEEIKNTRGYSLHTPQRFMTQLTPADQALLIERMDAFPGFEFQSRTLRHYEYKYAAHVLGSIGEVNADELAADSTYRMGDYIGKSGIERTYEKELRGVNGQRIYLRNVYGVLQGKYRDGEMDVPAQSGADITTTIDIDLQGVAEELLKGKIGSVVAIEPSTGEVLCMASSPTWDPALLIGRQRSIYYPQLQNDKTRPLLNRATNGTYPPGSTFKTVQALICQQGGAITPQTTFICNGPASQPIRCTHHHATPTNLLIAIEQSCNPYFWHAYRSMLEKNGNGKGNAKMKQQYAEWQRIAMSFGLGQHFSDSDIPSGRRGRIPDTTYYDRIYGARGWRALTIRSNAIGQGEVELTPLQMANCAAIIANGGYYITPHINKHDSMLVRRHNTEVNPEYFPIVREGMLRVCEQGTGRAYKVEGIKMGGKTGTADNSRSRPHSMFIAFAPYENPKIAIAVAVENAGFGATFALPIASLCIEQYLTGEIKRTELFKNMSSTVLNPNVK